MKAAIVVFPGSNCDRDVQVALRQSMQASAGNGGPVMVWHKDADFEKVDLIVLPGGFSYGDYLRCGAMAAHSPAMKEVVRRARAGVPVLGICNGFQVLLEAGLFGAGEITTGRIPGPGRARDIALYANASNHYECRWVTLESQACACPWLVPGELMPCPVAHAEGRFVVRDPATLERLVQRGQIALRYAPPPDAAGSDPGTAPGYPANPNGSVHDVAGICDSSGRVLGLMPHPERNLTPWNHPLWTRMGARSEGEGLNFFRRMVEAASGALV